MATGLNHELNPGDPILDAVREALAPELTPGVRVVLGLSGGLDSIVLLHALATLREPMSFELSAVHVHHGLSPNADTWASFCIAQSKALGLVCRVMRVNVSDNPGEGLEQAARVQRYAAFASVQGEVLCLAHHQNDRAETFLLNLFRGASVTGLAGVPGTRFLGDKRLVRPLIDVPRSVMAAWADARGLGWIEDESNKDLRYRRNHVRHRVLPVIAESFPGVIKVLTRTAGQMQEQLALMDRLAEVDAKSCRGPSGYLSIASLKCLPEGALRNVLRHAFTQRGLQISSAQRMHALAKQLMTTRSEAEVLVRMGEIGIHLWRDQIWLDSLMNLSPPKSLALSVGKSIWADGELEIHASGSVPVGLEICPLGCGQHYQPARRYRDRLTEHLRAKGVPPWVRARLPGIWHNGKLVWVAVLGPSTEWLSEFGSSVEVVWKPKLTVKL